MASDWYLQLVTENLKGLQGVIFTTEDVLWIEL